jgi:hypothetical protein
VHTVFLRVNVFLMKHATTKMQHASLATHHTQQPRSESATQVLVGNVVFVAWSGCVFIWVGMGDFC